MPQLPYNPIATGGQPGSANQGFQQIGGVAADAFGAPQGRAIQSFGQEFGKTMNVVVDIDNAMRRENAESDIVKLSQDFFARQESELIERQRTTTGDATGFTQRYMENFNRERERLLATIQDPVRRNAIDARLAPSVRQFAQRAFQSQLQLQDTFEATDLDLSSANMARALLQGGGADFEPRVNREVERIQASRLPEHVKVERITALRATAATAAAYGIMQTNPAGLAAATGGTTPWDQATIQRESGGNPRAWNRNSTAVGLGQFLAGTWNALAATPEGRAAGLQPTTDNRRVVDGKVVGEPPVDDPRYNPEQSTRALQLYRTQNAKTLTDAGFEANSQNLYLAHFMGAAGATGFLRRLATNPQATAADGNPAAADANPSIYYARDGRARTNSEVFQVLTNNFANAPVGNAVNPAIINQLPPNQFAQIRDRAEREAARQTQQATVAQNNQIWQQENQALVQLNDGVISRAAITGLRDQGYFSDINRLQQWNNIADRQEAAAASFQTYQQLVASGGQGSGLVAAHKDAAEAAFGVFTRNGLNPFQATQQIVAATGVMPASGVTAIRAGLNSNDPNVQREAFNVGERVLFAGNRPDMVQGIAGGSELRDEILAMKTVRDAFGRNTAQADQELNRMIQERRSPDWGNRFQARQADLKPEMDRINQEPDKVMSDLNSALGAGMFRTTAPINPTTRTVLLRDYQSLLSRGMEHTGNLDAAKKWAQAKLTESWGFSQDPTGTQRLMQFPVERVFPRNETAPNEPFGYVYRVAQDALSRQGINVPTSQIQFAPTPDTARQVREGTPPSYFIYYQREVNGQKIFDRLPLPFRQDPAEVFEAGRALRVQDENRARTTTTPGTSRTSTPVGGRSSQAAEQDRIRQQENMRRQGLIPMVGGVEQVAPISEQ